MTVLHVNSLSAGYGDKTVISQISFSARPGEFIALIGPNGSGKSTLIKTIAGLITPSNGSAALGETDLSAIPLRERAKIIAYLAQQREAMPSMTVTDILELGRAPYRGRLGSISEAGHAAIDSAIETADLADLKARTFGTLSGGEQARVLLGRALATNARILLADEPVAALDPYYQLTIARILKDQAQAGKPVIAALHDLALAANMADRVIVLKDGEIFADGPPGDVLDDKTTEQVFKVRRPLAGWHIAKPV